MSKSVCLIYGFATGRWHGKLFKKTLQGYGFSIEPDARKASIIVAHSAGCFYLPPANKSQLIVMINPPYWPGKSDRKSMSRNIRQAATRRIAIYPTGYWLQKTIWNIFYLLINIPKAVSIARTTKDHELSDTLEHRRVVIIRNQNDLWLTPDIPKLLGKTEFRYYELPGHHDDCWLNPSPYIEVLKSIV
jgi:hypothetical protein